MIDLGISKLALIGAVALIVIGPEKLPKVARTVGRTNGGGSAPGREKGRCAENILESAQKQEK